MESDPEGAFTGMIYIETDGKSYLKSVGHAGYAEPGKDIVCAGVSALFCTLALSLDDDEATIDYQCGVIKAKPTPNNVALFRAFAIGCKAISEDFPENVKFKAV